MDVKSGTNLLAWVWWKVESEDGEEGDTHAGDDEVDGVEECFPPHGDVEGNVQVWLVTTRVELFVPEEDTPLYSLTHNKHNYKYCSY